MLAAERIKFFLCIAFAILASPYLITRIFLRTLRGSSRRPKKILIVPIITRVGDMVCATPVFRNLKLSMPDVHLSVVTSKRNIGIIVNNPRIDRLLNINALPYKGYFGRVRFLRDLILQDYDYAIALTNNPFNNLINLFTCAPHRIKMRAEERGGWEVATDWINTKTMVYKNHTFLPGFYASMLSVLGITHLPVTKEVFESPEGADRVEAFLSSVGFSDKRVVGISITAGNKIKEWGDDNFMQLARKITGEYADTRIVFIGSPADTIRIDEVLERLDNPAVYAGATSFSLEDLPSLVKRLAVYVAVDTGTIYVAHAQGIPLVDIIGPVDPREQPPSDATSIQVLPAGNRAPSSFTIKRAEDPREHEASLRATSVESVMSAVRKLLSE